MKFLKLFFAGFLIASSFAMSKAQASQRDFNNVATIIAIAALVKISVDLEPTNDPYWSYRGQDNCYYRPVTTSEERTSCDRNREYYYGGYTYQCVTVTNYRTDYIRSCR